MNKNKSPKNIIWVEDDAFLGSILMKKFSATGHNVSLAKSGDEAFELIKNTPNGESKKYIARLKI